MKIVLTGAGGLVGGEFARHLSAQHHVLPLKHHDLDITNWRAVRHLIFAEQPALIINCAVAGVDACERDPALAHAVNVAGTRNLAEASAEVDAEFLHISTNYVFDGERVAGSFYTIRDVPSPINVYGRTKLAAEDAAWAASRRSYVVRTSWVFGAGKDNFFSAAHRLLVAAKRLRATNDAWASTTYVKDLVRRVDEILARHHYATYHVVNAEVCSHYDFAVEAARVLKLTDREIEHLIEGVNESSIERIAPRPRYTPMRCLVSEGLGLTPMRDWRVAVADYIHSDG